jgi:glycosyltransferase involved in cell wall biosynthesis
VPATMSQVTVVVPVWDAYVEFLDGTLRSLREQDPPPHLLVVDNCSSAALPAVPEAEVVRSDRRLSVGAARSYGLARVDTPLVVFWDADDLMPPGTLALLSERMLTDPGLSLLATRIEEGGARRHHWPRRFTTWLATYPRLLALTTSISSQMPTVGAMMRTDQVRDAGGFPDLETGDDWVLGVALAFRGRVGVLDHVGRIYHQHDDSVWANRQTPGHLLEHARAVRSALSEDPAVPGPVKCGLPAIALAQWLVIRVVRPVARQARRVTT